MCLAIPARVVELLPDNMAQVDIGGVVQTISLDLVEDVALDDYVIVHVGFALQKLDQDEALQTLELIMDSLKFLQTAGDETEHA